MSTQTTQPPAEVKGKRTLPPLLREINDLARQVLSGWKAEGKTGKGYDMAQATREAAHLIRVRKARAAGLPDPERTQPKPKAPKPPKQAEPGAAAEKKPKRKLNPVLTAMNARNAELRRLNQAQCERDPTAKKLSIIEIQSIVKQERDAGRLNV